MMHVFVLVLCLSNHVHEVPKNAFKANFSQITFLYLKKIAGHLCILMKFVSIVLCVLVHHRAAVFKNWH